MIATTPSLDGQALAIVLAMVRGGNLASAGQLAGVDASTVYRTIRRIEQTVAQRLFERSRRGYEATDLGLRLAQHAERIEAELEAARLAAGAGQSTVGGTVRISTTDTLLHGVLLPALRPLLAAHPNLRIDISASNELANLMQREADIALRATLKPPPHLVGRQLGTIRAAVFSAKARFGRARAVKLEAVPWIAVDDALPEHLSVRWRRRQYPMLQPRILVNSIQSVFEGIMAGAGVGVVPLFLAEGRKDLIRLSDPIQSCETQLWLLSHEESRHLTRIAMVARHLANSISLG